MAKRSDVDRPPPNEPLPRRLFCSSAVKKQLYVWGGYTKRNVELSTVDRFDCNTEQWSSFQSNGSPPPQLINGACASDDHHLYVYGGGHGDSYSGSLDRLHVGTFTWTQLSPHSPEGPRKKSSCGMVVHEDHLIIFGGICGDTSGTTQPGASYDGGRTNELHIFDLREGKWSSPTVTGTRPPPCDSFSLTKTDDHHAVLFGGYLTGFKSINEVYIIDLEKMHWSKLDHPKGQPWPVERHFHAATILNYCQSYQQLLVTGGFGGGVTRSDVWMLDLQSGRWKEISLPEKYRKKRWCHCTAAFSLTPALTEVVMFGGRTAIFGDPLSATALLRFERSGVDWILKDCCDYSTGLGSMERVEMKRQYGSAVCVEKKPLKLPILLKELMPLASKWHNIGVLLGVSEGKLDTIEHDFKKAEDCLREMISTWLKMDDPEPTWEGLVEAVEVVDKKKAQDIIAKYTSLHTCKSIA